VPSGITRNASEGSGNKPPRSIGAVQQFKIQIKRGRIEALNRKKSDDSSLTHGNFKLELSTVEIDDVMPLIEQSLAFRRSDDYFKVYSRLVKNL